MIIALLLLPLISLLPLPLCGSQRLLLALALSILNFAHSTILVVLFDPTDAAFQFGQFLQLGLSPLRNCGIKRNSWSCASCLTINHLFT